MALMLVAELWPAEPNTAAATARVGAWLQSWDDPPAALKSIICNHFGFAQKVSYLLSEADVYTKSEPRCAGVLYLSTHG
jgi:hypothetical protein